MFKAMDIAKFKKYIKEHDCYIEFKTDHYNLIYNSQNEVVSIFAISHSKGSKKFVKAKYIDLFDKNIRNLNK